MTDTAETPLKVQIFKGAYDNLWYVLSTWPFESKIHGTFGTRTQACAYVKSMGAVLDESVGSFRDLI